MVWWAVVVQLVVGAATIAVAFRVGTRNAQETANATSQREAAARREEFWKRLTYALTAAGSENEAEAQVGFALLGALAVRAGQFRGSAVGAGSGPGCAATAGPAARRSGY